MFIYLFLNVERLETVKVKSQCILNFCNSIAKSLNPNFSRLSSLNVSIRFKMIRSVLNTIDPHKNKSV